MVQKSLVEYIRGLLQQGYDENSIRNTLLQAGYTTYDVQEGFNAARQPANKLLLIIFGTIAGLILIILVLLFLTRSEPSILALELTPYNVDVRPGEQILVNARITNPGKFATGLMDITITGPININVPSQQVEVRERTSIPIEVTIPSDAPQGQYVLQVILSYKLGRATKTQPFSVTESAPAQQKPAQVVEYVREEQARQQQKTCPKGCDDLDPCTRDECVQGVCKHTPITPCCGNGICEQGEEECPDCKPDIIEEAASVAKADSRAGLKKCASAAQKDQCIKEVAIASGDKTACAQIMESEIKDACYMHFAFNKDFTVCELITNKYTQNSCYTLRNLAKYD